MAAADAQSAKQAAAVNLQRAHQEVVARQAQESAAMKEGVAAMWLQAAHPYGGSLLVAPLHRPALSRQYTPQQHTGWMQAYIGDLAYYLPDIDTVSPAAVHAMVLALTAKTSIQPGTERLSRRQGLLACCSSWWPAWRASLLLPRQASL